MSFSEADTRVKLIDPAIHKCGWTKDLKYDSYLNETTWQVGLGKLATYQGSRVQREILLAPISPISPDVPT